MGIPVIFLSFIVFVILYRIQLAKADNDINNKNKKFWQQERDSLFVRKKAINDTDFIAPNLSDLPTYSLEEYVEFGDKDLFRVQEKCHTYGQGKMLNTTNLLNSEIRIKYGSSNLDTVETYENNYGLYIKMLFKLGKGFYELNRLKDAITVLEEGLHVQTDISDHIILLGNLYSLTNQQEKITTLIEYANTIDSLVKAKIINGLKNIH